MGWLLRALITKVLKTFLKDEEIKGLFQNKDFIKAVKTFRGNILKTPQKLKEMVLDVTGVKKAQQEVKGAIKKTVEKVVPDEVLELRKKVKDYYNQLRYWKNKAQNLTNVNKLLKNAFKKIDDQTKEIEKLKREIEKLKKEKEKEIGDSPIPPKTDFLEIGLKLNEELYDYYEDQGIKYRFRQGKDYVTFNWKSIKDATRDLDLDRWIEKYKEELENILVPLCTDLLY